MSSTWTNYNQIIHQSGFNYQSCLKDRARFMHGLPESGWHCLLLLKQLRHLGSTRCELQTPGTKPTCSSQEQTTCWEQSYMAPTQVHWKLTHHQASRPSTAVYTPAPLDSILLSSRLPDFLSSIILIPLMGKLKHGSEAACSHLIKATLMHISRAELPAELC